MAAACIALVEEASSENIRGKYRGVLQRARLPLSSLRRLFPSLGPL